MRSHHAEIPSDANADAHTAEAELQVVLGLHYRRMVQVAAEAGASTTAAAATTSAGLLRADDRLLLLLLLLTVVLLGGFQRVVLHFVLLFSLAPRLFIDFLHRPQLLLQLHPTVLEPDFDLPLGQAEGVRDFDPSSAGQVVVEVELFLQLERLEAGVRLPASSTGTSVGT